MVDLYLVVVTREMVRGGCYYLIGKGTDFSSCLAAGIASLNLISFPSSHMQLSSTYYQHTV